MHDRCPFESPIPLEESEADGFTKSYVVSLGERVRINILSGAARKFSPEEFLDQVFNFLITDLVGVRRCPQS